MDNLTALNAYKEHLNKQARAREYFLSLIGDEPLYYIEHVKIQASVLAQLTAATNQLTRNASVGSEIFGTVLLNSCSATRGLEMPEIGSGLRVDGIRNLEGRRPFGRQLSQPVRE